MLDMSGMVEMAWRTKNSYLRNPVLYLPSRPRRSSARPMHAVVRATLVQNVAAGIPFLLSVNEAMEIKTSTLSDQTALPLVVEPADGRSPTASELTELIIARQDWLRQMLHRHGGVLFRGFLVREIDEFQKISRAVIPELKAYVEGQSPRKKVADNVYTSTEFPPQYTITLHNELSYAKSPPPRIIFHCHIAPAEGGETPIVDCRKVYSAIDPELRARFEQRGVRYAKNMHGDKHGLGKSWQEHFETDDRLQVEGYLRENDITFEWTREGACGPGRFGPGR